MERIDIFEHLKTGDVVFFRDSFSWNPMTWLATLIRFFAKIKYNHVGVIIDNDIYEAIGSGVVRRPFRARLIGRKVKINRKKQPAKAYELRQLAYDCLGRKYDFAGLFWFQLWFQLFKKWIGFKSQEKAARRFYCYEFAAYVNQEPDWWKVNPKEFLNSKKYIEIFEGTI